MTAAKHADLNVTPPAGSEALPSGTSLLGDQFTIERPLSNGGFGITYLAQDNFLNRRVVIKECYPEVFCRRHGRKVLVRSTVHEDKYRAIVQMFMREARAIARLRHPNIVGVHRIFEDNETAYMVLDLVEGRDLLTVIKDTHQEVAPDLVRELLLKVLDAIDLVHQHDLLHRDISPDNILLDKWGNPVLIDFGAAREEASRETRAVSAVLVVKDGYSPQEFYFAGGKQSPSSDLYALGATFYHLISGEAPPNSQTRMSEFASQNPDPCEPLAGRFPEYPPEFLEAVDQAMAILPRERIQTARAWINIITGRADGPRPVRQIPADDLNKVLTRLVSETNEYIGTGNDAQRKTRKPSQSEPKRVLKTLDAETETATDDSKAWSEPVFAEPGKLVVPAKRKRRGLFGLFSRN